MLVKRELLTIPLAEYPELPPLKKGVYLGEFVAAAQKVKLPRSGEIIAIDIFDEKNKSWELRFVSDGKNALICEEWPTENWKFGQPWRALGMSSGYGHIRASEKDEKLVCGFLDTSLYISRSICDAMRYFVCSIYEEKAYKAREKKYEKLREHIDMYPDYPDDLAEYCDKHAFPHTWIFIGKLENGKRKALCCHCRKRFKADKSVTSGHTGECPKCGKVAKYRWERMHSSPVEKVNICIAAEVDGQVLLRWTEVKRVLSVKKKHSSHEFDDYWLNLYLKKGNGITIYSYAWHHVMCWGWQWWRKKNGETNDRATYVYANNLSEIYGNPFCHVDLERLRDAGEVPFVNLLQNLKEVPATEYLYKFGLMSLAASWCVKEIKSRNFSEALGVRKEYFPMLCKHNATWPEIQIVKAANSWVSEESFIKYRNLQLDNSHDNVIDALEMMSFERFANYFTKQRELERKLKKSKQILQWYVDYVGTSELLGVDLSRKSVRFPKNLREAHDRIVGRYNSEKHELDEAILVRVKEKLYAGLKEYAKGDFRIVFPLTRADFIAEGQSLNHCVGTDDYFDRHIKGERMVFFVRKSEEPDKPYYTLEVDMLKLTIRQLYGFGDVSAGAEVRKFANEFLRRLKPERRSA